MHMIPTRIGAINRTMRVLVVTPLLLFATMLASCQSVTSADSMAASGPTAKDAATLRRPLQAIPPLDGAGLYALRDAAASRQPFLGIGELGANYQRLRELESEALRLAEDEPLKLGAIGTAILDICQGSLTGHYALQRFYDYLDAPETAQTHAAWVSAIKAEMRADADGSDTAPYTALTPAEAQIFVISESLSPVGSIYQSNDSTAFSILVIGRPKAGPLRELHFDLEAFYQHAAYRHGVNTLSSQSNNQARHAGFSTSALIGLLARRGDSSAQATVGALMIGRGQLDEAIGWLRSASRPGNVLANVMLARVYWEQSGQANNAADKRAALDQVVENYLHGIALGSADAMYALGSLYLSGAFEERRKAEGLPLLEQAGALEHGDALLYLAHLHYAGEVVERDLAQAEEYFIHSASLNNATARLSYARYLMRAGAEAKVDARAIAWLQDLVEENDDPEAMLLLGNLHARGIAATQNIRKARRWYQNAVRTAPDNPDIVNEVAWTLTVSDLDRLRRERFANKIMTRMMEADEQARSSPEFLDTWAATFAATGNFEEAVRLQQLAVKEATDAEREDVLDILHEHLDLFRAGQPVIETAP